MTVRLPELPFAPDALSPDISAETISFHYGKHHAGYVAATNKLIADTDLADKPLTEIILTAAADTVLTPVFNNAAQCFNHEFYWQSLSPEQSLPPPSLQEALDRDFGSREAFEQAFQAAGLARFGSGWVWLVRDGNRHLQIITTGNAETPLTRPDTYPLLCIDVWEHAYYLDYQNRRADYLKNIITRHLNWRFAGDRFSSR